MNPSSALRQEARSYAYVSTNTLPHKALPDEVGLRLATYIPKAVNKQLRKAGWACPHCAIRDGVRDSILGYATGTDEYDLLICGVRHCNAEFLIPFEA